MMSGDASSQNPSETKSQNDGTHSLIASTSRLSNKEFVSPLLKAGHKAPKVNAGVNEIKPRYSPNYPSALVMPRPPTDIQVLCYNQCYGQSLIFKSFVSFSGKNRSVEQSSSMSLWIRCLAEVFVPISGMEWFSCTNV